MGELQQLIFHLGMVVLALDESELLVVLFDVDWLFLLGEVAELLEHFVIVDFIDVLFLNPAFQPALSL